MNSPQDIEPPFDLEPNEDIIERSVEGEPTLWLWVQTCPIEDCPCRTALVVVAKDKQTLGEHVNLVRDTWDEAEDAEGFVKSIGEVAPDATIVAFELDIDSGDIAMPLSESEELSKEVTEVASLVDGELLDRIASLWYLGKDQEDSSVIAVEPSKLTDYRIGQLLAWDEVHEGARMDVFRVPTGDDFIEAEAIDTYCVRPKCECNEVRIQFYEVGEEEGYIGTVAVKLEEPVGLSFHCEETRRSELEAFWLKYQARHPRWVMRLSHRADEMQKFAEKLHEKPQGKPQKPWVGSSRKRNPGPKRSN